jgi:hypothetical protein
VPFLTLALVGGERSASCPGQFSMGKEPPVSTGKEVEWASQPVWILWRREISLALAGNKILVPGLSSSQPITILSELFQVCKILLHQVATWFACAVTPVLKVSGQLHNPAPFSPSSLLKMTMSTLGVQMCSVLAHASLECLGPVYTGQLPWRVRT